MLGMVETSRQIWNDALAYRKQRWEVHKLSTSYNLQAWILSAERASNSDRRMLLESDGQTHGRMSHTMKPVLR
jgi:hypothetical protein